MAHFWTPEEDARLIELYHTMPQSKIATILDRSVDAINNRAGRLKIRRNQKNSRKPLPKPCLKRVTDWSPLLNEILDKAVELHEQGIVVECKTRHEGSVELMAFFAEIKP